MLEFLQREAPPKVEDVAAVREARAAFDEAERVFQDIEKRWRRCDQICRPGPGADVPADAYEQEIETAFVIWPHLRKERHELKTARDAADANVKRAEAAARRARMSWACTRLADHLGEVVQVLDGDFRQAVTAFADTMTEMRSEKLFSDVELPSFCRTEALDGYLEVLRQMSRNWHADSELFARDK